MAIPRETVDTIYNTLKIEEVVGDYVSLKRKGAGLWGLCPFPGHNEKTPSFQVNPARNICKCFGCGRGGNAVGFVMEMEQCSYPEALRKIAKKYHIEIEERELTAEEQQRHDDRESMLIVNEWANNWFQQQLWESEEGRAIGLSYFRERGLKDDTIRRFQLGYSPEKAWLLPQAAKEKGFQEMYLLNDLDSRIGTGICGKGGQAQKLYDRYHDRVIFPFIGISGKIVGFAGRIIKKNDNVGKYVNSPESIVYSKKNELFGLFQAKKTIHKDDKCYLVEGQMDCISMSQAGIENVVCSGGTALTKEQIRLIHRFTENVTILYDGDAAGIHAALRGIDMFLEEGLNVKVMLFPDGDDPDSFARKHTSDEFVQFIAANEEDFIRYKTRTLLGDAGNDLRKRSEAMHSILTSISLISDRITRELYLKDVAQQFNIKEVTLIQEVEKERRQRFEEARKERERKEAIAKGIYSESNSRTSENEPPIIGVDDEPASAAPQAAANTEQLTAKDENVQNLLRALVRYGSEEMRFLNPDGTEYSVMVGDFMANYIASTRLPLGKTLYQRFFDEFAAHKNEPGFVAEEFFCRHADPEISKLVTDLLADQYTLSNFYAKQESAMDANKIMQLVTKLLYELQFTVVEENLKAIADSLNNAQTQNDPNLYTQTVQAQIQLLEIRQQLCTLLGIV